MLIERQKKKLTAIRRMRKIANRPAKHRALQHSAHASLRAFFPLELFVDRSVYLPRRPAVSLGFETGQRCPNSRRNDWNQIYLKEREKREMQRTRQSRRARLDETNNARHFCTVLFFFLKAAASLLWMHNPPPWGTTTQEAWGWANRFLSTIPTLKRTRVYKTKSKTKSKTSKWIKISNWYGRKTWTVVKFLKRWKRMDDILRQKILFF